MNVFVAQNGVRTGPYTENDIRERVAQKQILVSDLAWFEGCAGWKRIDEIPELLEAIIPPLPQGQHHVIEAITDSQPPPVETPKEPELAPIPIPPPISTQKGKSKSAKGKVKPLSVADFWPKERSGRVFAMIVAMTLLLLFLLIICFGGLKGFFVVMGIVAIAAILLCILKAFEPKIVTEASNGYGKRHVIAGIGIIVFGALLGLIAIGIAINFGPGSGSGFAIMLMSSLGLLTFGGSWIVKARESIKLRKGESKPPTDHS